MQRALVGAWLLLVVVEVEQLARVVQVVVEREGVGVEAEEAEVGEGAVVGEVVANRGMKVMVG